MLSTDEYFKMFYVVDKMEDIGGFIVSPIPIEEGKLYSGYTGTPPKEVVGIPELIEAESIQIFDDLESLRKWQEWCESPMDSDVQKPKLNVVPMNRKTLEETE